MNKKVESLRLLPRLLVLLLACDGLPADAQEAVPLEPPAGADRFVLLSPLGAYGEAATWVEADGRRLWLESSGAGSVRTVLQQAVHLGGDGGVASVVIRRAGVAGPPEETFEAAAGRYRWRGPYDAEEGEYSQPVLYVPSAAPSLGAAQLLAETVLRAPGRTVALLPLGRASAEALARLSIGSGTRRITVLLWAITGIGVSPIPVWTTTDHRFFASIDMPTAVPAGFVPDIVPAGREDALPALQAAQDRALSRRSARLARSLGGSDAPVAFSPVRIFRDGRFSDNQTVVVRQGRIRAVGAAGTVPLPRGVRVIDGTGHTLLPGLWDYHRHVEDDATGPFLLSLGITSIRDPSNDNARTQDRWRRRAQGRLLGPRVHASALIDGEGPNSTRTRTSWIGFGDVVASRDAAVDAVRRAAARGFTGVKFYGSIEPTAAEAAIREAHRLGLRVHGHLPSGWRPGRAIDAGYDEITHGYFMMLEAMPQDIVSTSETRNRFAGPARLGRDVDLAAEPMAGLAARMARQRIAADPTLTVVEWLFTAENGALAPAYLPYAMSAPPWMQRRFRLGFAAATALEDGRASFRKMVEMVGGFHRAGVVIAAGTDSSGLELVRELELYVEAGMTPAEAITSATLIPATLLGLAAETGSIAVGKRADLVLVEGDPSRSIGDLRNTRFVVAEGRLLDADMLRAVSGFSARPLRTTGLAGSASAR